MSTARNSNILSCSKLILNFASRAYCGYRT